MANVKFTKVNYATEDTIVAFPEHCIAVGHTFEKDDAASVVVDGRKLVKAGTIVTYTDDNGDTKTGVVRYTVDVTDGNADSAIIRHGWIRTNKMPVAPTSAEKQAMPQIEFV